MEQIAPKAEPVQEPDLSTWSEEDKKWLEGLPTELRGPAKRHGRFCFEMVMAAGTATECLNVLVRSRPPQQVMTAVGVLNQMLQQIAGAGLRHAGISPEMFGECKTDVERAAMLVSAASQQGEKRSPSGLILNS